MKTLSDFAVLALHPVQLVWLLSPQSHKAWTDAKVSGSSPFLDHWMQLVRLLPHQNNAERTEAKLEAAVLLSCFRGNNGLTSCQLPCNGVSSRPWYEVLDLL